MRNDIRELHNIDALPMATAQKVKNMIIQREMKPGDRLPTEKELVDLFGVSRSTLREAMKFLRAENVVVIRQGSGTFVSAGTGIGDDPLGLHFTNQEHLIQNLFETRMLIEPQIACLAVERATPQDIKNLERLVKEMDQIQVNSTATAEMDVQFHTAVAECTHNDVLIRVVPIINESIRRSHVETHDDLESFKRAKRSHAGICRAIAQGNYVEAKFLAERHVWETLNDIKETEERK
ncbi:MAG: FadR family transcriptional regulator [Clostridium sp.]|nr:FadR family transcriptional regulator [Clostridium sp.]